MIPPPAASTSARPALATLADVVVATTAGAAFALVDLRVPARPSWSDAAAPALLLVALIAATLSPARPANSVHPPSALARLALWVALWLAVPLIAFAFGLEPEATLLALPTWLLVAACAALGAQISPTNVPMLLGLGAIMGLVRAVLGSAGEFWQREAIGLVVVGVVFAVLHRTIGVLRRKAASPIAHRNAVMETGLFVGAGVWIYLGTFFLIAGTYDTVGDLNAGHSVLWGAGLGAYDDLRLESLDRHSIDAVVSRAKSSGVELGLLLPIGFIALLVSSFVSWPDCVVRQQRSSSDAADAEARVSDEYSLMPACLGLITALLFAIRMPLHWLNGWLMLSALLIGCLGQGALRWPVASQQSTARLASRGTIGVGVLALLVAIGQPIVLARTAASIQRSGAIPDWAEALPWTVPLRERCIRLREGTGAPGAPDPAPELNQLAERWTRLAPHDEYAWIERVRAVYAADGPAAAEPIARQATTRLPASPILARWLVRCLEETGRIDEAIAHIDAMRQRFGVLHPTLLQWREAASAS